MSQETDKNEKKKGSDVEDVIDKVLEKSGVTTILKLQPNSPGEQGDQEIDAMLAMLGLKKVGKPIVVIDTINKNNKAGRQE